MSPSRNQTPGAISLTVFGCASPRVTTNARANIATNTPAAIGRANLISRLLEEPAIPAHPVYRIAAGPRTLTDPLQSCRNLLPGQYYRGDDPSPAGNGSQASDVLLQRPQH